MSDEKSPVNRGDVIVAGLGGAVGGALNISLDPFITDEQREVDAALKIERGDLLDDLDGLNLERSRLDAAKPIIAKRAGADGEESLDIAIGGVNGDIKDTKAEIAQLDGKIDRFLVAKDYSVYMGLFALGAITAYGVKRHGGKAVRLVARGVSNLTSLRSNKESEPEIDSDKSAES